MRLTEHARRAVVTAIRGVDPMARVYLFGSRVDDSKKGGDIDLLLVLSDPVVGQQALSKKHLILSDMLEKLGDQKIDLVIEKKENVGVSPFLKIIFPSSLLLRAW